MAEIFNHFPFRRKPHSEKAPKKEQPASYGFVLIGTKEAPKNERFTGASHIVSSTVWAGSVHDPVTGEVASNVNGLVETVHSPITLTIKPAVKSLPKGEVFEKPQEIGNIASHTTGKKHYLAERWSKTSRESTNLQAQIAELNQQLQRLSAEQSSEAQKLVGNATKKADLLKTKEQQALTDLQNFTNEHFPNPHTSTLEIKSLNGDLTLIVEDPNVAISISPKFSQRETEPEITGRLPENQDRTIKAFTYRGKIVIKYPRPQSTNPSNQ